MQTLRSFSSGPEDTLHLIEMEAQCISYCKYFIIIHHNPYPFSLKRQGCFDVSTLASLHRVPKPMLVPTGAVAIPTRSPNVDAKQLCARLAALKDQPRPSNDCASTITDPCDSDSFVEPTV